MTERWPIDCPHCHGEGIVKRQTELGWIVIDCPKCEGWGWICDQPTGAANRAEAQKPS